MSYFLCIHRWVEDQAKYEDYPIPADIDLRFVCTRESRHRADAVSVSTDVVESLDNPEATQACIQTVIARHGIPDRVIALNEQDLLTAAWVRETYGIDGDRSTEVSRFRDKLEMASVVSSQADVRVLRSASTDQPADVDVLLAETGFPIVLKPRFGAGSRGVVFAADRDELLRAVGATSEPSMIQEFCDDPIHHVDGWWDGKHIVVATASMYLNTCADFGADSALGSVELPFGPEEQRLLEATCHVLGVLALGRELVFHLELFSRGGSATFLELGARVGGAEIPFIWRDLRGVDLYAIAWEIQAGVGTEHRDAVRRRGLPGSERGGWVLGRGLSSATRPPSNYWTASDQPRRAASGIYEGSSFRARLRNRCAEELLRDSRSLVSAASGSERPLVLK